MSKFSSCWVFTDAAARLAEFIGGAQQLADHVHVFVLTQAEAESAFALGASGVWILSGKPQDRMIEDYADAMTETLRAHSDSGLVLLPATRRGKLMAARLGARLAAAVANDISTLTIENACAVAKHMVFGGLAMGEERLLSPWSVVTLSTGAFEPASFNGDVSGTAKTVLWRSPKAAVIRTASQAKQSNTVDLDKAKRVVSVGRGIGNKENIALASALCQAIGAELACSRPVAENEKWMEHERYVGISNLMIKPDLYLAVGISGQIQHMVGANGAQTIVAINKDKNAPIFQYADYGIVGDLFRVLPALTAALSR